MTRTVEPLFSIEYEYLDGTSVETELLTAGVTNLVTPADTMTPIDVPGYNVAFRVPGSLEALVITFDTDDPLPNFYGTIHRRNYGSAETPDYPQLTIFPVNYTAAQQYGFRIARATGYLTSRTASIPGPGGLSSYSWEWVPAISYIEADTEANLTKEAALRYDNALTDEHFRNGVDIFADRNAALQVETEE